MKKQLGKIISNAIEKLPYPGVLLLCGNKTKENLITVGWVQFGILWSEPVINIYIRPSRYSYKLLQENNEFTLNIMSDKFNIALSFCGTHSGSYCDKFKETGLNRIPSSTIDISSLKDADIVLECRVIYKEDITPENLSDFVQAKYYSDGNFHQMLTAIILNIRQNV